MTVVLTIGAGTAHFGAVRMGAPTPYPLRISQLNAHEEAPAPRGRIAVRPLGVTWSMRCRCSVAGGVVNHPGHS